MTAMTVNSLAFGIWADFSAIDWQTLTFPVFFAALERIMARNPGARPSAAVSLIEYDEDMLRVWRTLNSIERRLYEAEKYVTKKNGGHAGSATVVVDRNGSMHFQAPNIACPCPDCMACDGFASSAAAANPPPNNGAVPVPPDAVRVPTDDGSERYFSCMCEACQHNRALAQQATALPAKPGDKAKAAPKGKAKAKSTDKGKGLDNKGKGGGKRALAAKVRLGSPRTKTRKSKDKEHKSKPPAADAEVPLSVVPASAEFDKSNMRLEVSQMDTFNCSRSAGGDVQMEPLKSCTSYKETFLSCLPKAEMSGGINAFNGINQLYAPSGYRYQPLPRESLGDILQDFLFKLTLKVERNLFWCRLCLCGCYMCMSD